MAENLFRTEISPFIDRARIECDRLFDFRCPMYWGDLDTTEDPTVRHCRACDNPVFLVASEELLIERAERGECVAIVVPEELPRPGDRIEEPHLVLGRVSPDRWDDD